MANIHVIIETIEGKEERATFSSDMFLRLPVIGEEICISSKDATGCITNILHIPEDNEIIIIAAEELCK